MNELFYRYLHIPPDRVILPVDPSRLGDGGSASEGSKSADESTAKSVDPSLALRLTERERRKAGRRHIVTLCAIFSITLPLLTSCGKPSHDHDHETAKTADSSSHKHEHHAPHGGTAVELGDEAYHLEFVLVAKEGKLQAFVLDGEMENFVRCPAPSFEIVATVGGQKYPLLFSAVADAATGEKVGDTALFEAQADWLKTTPTFDAVLTTLTIKGTPFTNVPFNFPLGNDHD